MTIKTEPTEFTALLPSGQETGDQLEQRQAQIDQLRKRSPRQFRALFHHLLREYSAMAGHRAVVERDLIELREVLAEQRRLIGELTAPAWYPVMFLGFVETDSGPLAEVFLDGRRRLVSLGQGVRVDDLVVGRMVYLGHERNALFGVARTELPEAGEIATVEWVTEDGRLALRDRDQLILVQRARRLHDAALSPGDSVRWHREAMLALDQSYTIDFPLEVIVHTDTASSSSDSEFIDSADYTDCDRTAAPAGQGPQDDVDS